MDERTLRARMLLGAEAMEKIEKSTCLDNKDVSLIVDINPNNMI